jgi:Fe-S-cluster containining protein
MNLVRFRRVAARQKASLTAFLKKLDEIVPEDFQPLVRQTDAEVWSQIDCTACAHCCKTMTPTFKRADVLRIARHLDMKPKAFMEQWLMQDEETGDWVNKSTPCQFLRADNKCGIYEVRPADCREFPHHDKEPFDLWNDTYIGNVDKCPATYELVKRLKQKVERDYEW